MLIIPAIDLLGGRCVRLTQGDFARETRYGDDPVEIAQRWAQLGARWLHVVDLDGARAGHPVQLDAVRAIAAVGVPVELGGGLRTLDDLRAALAAGVSRVILGTVAVEQPSLMRAAVEMLGTDRVVLGVDARDGLVAVRGWGESSGVSVAEVIETAGLAGIGRVIYTDIERDGTLSSPNFASIRQVAGLGMPLIASGGVGTREHLRTLAMIPGVEAAIVGKALYAETLVVCRPDDWDVRVEEPDEREN